MRLRDSAKAYRASRACFPTGGIQLQQGYWGWAIAGLAVAIAFLALAGTASAYPLVHSHESGKVVSGNVTLEAYGGSRNLCDGIPEFVWIDVTKNGVVLESWGRYGPQPLVATWRTEGRYPNGDYVLRHWRASGIGWAWPCYQQSGVFETLTLTVQNPRDVPQPPPPATPDPTSLQVVAPTVGFWQETVTIVATLTNARTGEPVYGREISLSFGAQEAVLATGPSGIARVTLPLQSLPSDAEITVSFPGEAQLLPSSASRPFTILPRPTLVTYEGAREGVRGLAAPLSARVVDATPGSARYGEPLAEATVRFELAGEAWSASTDEAGVARLDVRVLASYGQNAITASFGGMPGRAMDAHASTILVLWQHVFLDDRGAGAVRVNLVTREFQLAHGAWESGVKTFDDATHLWGETDAAAEAPLASAADRRGVLAFEDEEVALAAAFDLRTGAFAAVARAPHGVLVLERDTILPRL